MKRVVAYLFAICFMFHLQSEIRAQTYYTKLTTYEYPAALNTNCILKNGLLYVNGMVIDSVYPYSTLNLFAEVDVVSGDTNYIKTYQWPSTPSVDYWQNTFIETHYNNGFATAGNIDGGQKGIVLFFDSTGTVINTIELADTTAMKILPKSMVFHQNAIYCLGTKQELTYDGTLFLCKIDTTGNIVWTKYYGIGSLTDKAGCIISDGADLIIGAARSTIMQVPYTVEDDSHTWIFSIDTAGNVIDEWFDPDSHTYWPNSMLVKPDGNLVMVGAYRGNYVYSSWNEILWKGYAAELDLNTGTKVWWWADGAHSPITYLNDIDDTGDGYLITGTYGFTARGWLIVTNYTGSILWNRKYGGVDSNFTYCSSELCESEVLPNGDYISVGLSLVYNNGSDAQHQAWIIRTDEKACLTCYLYGTENETEAIGRIYPNPTTNYLIVELSTFKDDRPFEIININGQVCKTGVLTNSLTQINVEDLANGIYMFQLMEGNSLHPIKFIKN